MEGNSFYSLLFVVLGILSILKDVDAFRIDDDRILTNRVETQFAEDKFQEDIKIKVVERPLFIGSYNVQTLGKKKLGNDDIMINLERVVHRYDLILITELMTNDKRLIGRFLSNVNRFAPEGVTYNLTMNNDILTNEFSAFLYRVDKLKVIKVDSYSDPRKFYRSPYFVLFQSPTLRDMKRFGVIGFHVKPSQAVQEISALADVYDFMKMKHKVEDILLMGDFNADCSYVKEDDWEKISLWTRPEFTWPIGHGTDTTTNYRSCTLDRFVYAGENMNSGVILASARSLDLQQEFGLSLQEVRSLSDHKPIEIKIRGKMSDTGEQHLTSESCFTVKDSRMPNVTQSEAVEAGKAAHYTTQVSQSGTIFMKNSTKDFEDMMGALKSLKRAMPLTFTNEQYEAILYKLEEGALEDRSSYADEQNVFFGIDYSILKNHCAIMVCKTSTIN